MSISRRDFFKISALPVFTSLALSRESVGQTNGSNNDSSDVLNDRLMTLRAADFRYQIGSKFKLLAEGVTLNAVLTEVKKAESSGANQSNNTSGDLEDLKCFSLTFKLNGVNPGKQATYKVKHHILGDFQLFLVPGSLGSRQPSLIAIINRSR